MNILLKGSLISVLIGVLSGASIAYSCAPGPGCPGGNGGSINMDTFSTGGGQSFDFTGMNDFTGFSYGKGTSLGQSGALLNGSVTDGTVEGDVSSTGGGFSDTTVFKTANSIGSESYGFGITEGSLYGKVDPTKNGSGSVYGSFSGTVNQDTFNKSTLTTGIGFDSSGSTYGVASQQGNGYFTGSGWATSGPDAHGKNSYGEFGVNAGIVIEGSSGTESYRFANNNGGLYTEGIGSNMYAQTTVTSYGDGFKNANKNGAAGYTFKGGYCVDGLASGSTVQFNSNGLALSNTSGKYSGGGSLGTGYTGSAQGYTFTSLTTGPGGGSISYAEAGMKVSSKVE